MSYVDADGPSSEEASASALAAPAPRTSGPTADGVLAIVLHLRQRGTRDLLAQLLEVNTSTLPRAVRQVHPL